MLDRLMEDIASALPESASHGRQTVREVCLTYYGDGRWTAIAGGHPSVHIGEWGGDFEGSGDTAEDALVACLKNIKR
jgi:hypothetical protein